MKLVKKQHRIPVMYLKRFTDIKDGNLHIYDSRERKFYKKKPKSFGFDEFATELLKDDDKYIGLFEKEMSNKEAIWDKAFNRIERDFSIIMKNNESEIKDIEQYKSDIWLLLEFCFYQYIRSFEYADFAILSGKFKVLTYNNGTKRVFCMPYINSNKYHIISMKNGSYSINTDDCDCSSKKGVKLPDSLQSVYGNKGDCFILNLLLNFNSDFLEREFLNFKNNFIIENVKLDVTDIFNGSNIFMINNGGGLRLPISKNLTVIIYLKFIGDIDFKTTIEFISNLKNKIGFALAPRFFIKSEEFTDEEVNSLLNNYKFITGCYRTVQNKGVCNG